VVEFLRDAEALNTMTYLATDMHHNCEQGFSWQLQYRKKLAPIKYVEAAEVVGLG